MSESLSQLDPAVISDADQIDHLVRQVLGPDTASRRLIIAFFATQATWIGGAVAIRLARLAMNPDPARSRMAADALASLADELALPLAGRLRDRNRHCRKDCTEALKVCMPFLTPSRRQEVGWALLPMIVMR